MSVFTIIENWDGEFKNIFRNNDLWQKDSESTKSKLVALTIGGQNCEQIKKYGADKIINIKNLNFENTTNTVIANICSKYIEENDANLTILSNTNTGKSISPLIANKINHGLITNAISLPDSYSPLTVQCKGFSGKAHVKYQSNYNSNLITIIPNSIGEISEKEGAGEIFNVEYDVNNEHQNIKILSRNKSSEKISLPDANIVVSAGRGLKGPENWNMIEELAEILGAGTACS